MQLEQLSEDLQEYILNLEYGPYSLQTAVEDRLDTAETLEEFRDVAVAILIEDMASYEDAVNTIAGKTVVELTQIS